MTVVAHGRAEIRATHYGRDMDVGSGWKGWSVSRPADGSSAASTAQGPQLTQSPHRAHWQPMTYDALHGGMEPSSHQ